MYLFCRSTDQVFAFLQIGLTAADFALWATLYPILSGKFEVKGKGLM